MYANEHKLDILAITESWLHKEIDNSEISLKDFTLYRKDRDEIKGGRGGGVLLFIRNSLLSSACEELMSKSGSVFCKIVPEQSNEFM